MRIYGDRKGSEIIRSLAANVQGEPPQRTTHQTRQSTHLERTLKFLHLVNGCLGEEANGLTQLDKRQTRRILDACDEHRWLALVGSLHRNARDALRIFVELWPRELDVRTTQFGKLIRDPGVRLGENAGPSGTLGQRGSRLDQRLEVHQALHRDRRHLTGEMQNITHESPWKRKRNRLTAHKLPSDRFFGTEDICPDV